MAAFSAVCLGVAEAGAVLGAEPALWGAAASQASRRQSAMGWESLRRPLSWEMA